MPKDSSVGEGSNELPKKVDTYFLKHKNQPMKALFEALNDEANGIELPLAIVMDPRCGIERASEKVQRVELKLGIGFLFGATPLMMAVYVGRLDVAKALIAAGANLAAADYHGQTPLHISASRKVEAVEDLVRAGANLEMVDFEGKTPLHIGALFGQVKAVEALVMLGASLNAGDDVGRTALHNAARCGNVETMEALVNVGANFEAADKGGRTPLHSVTNCGNVEVIEALVKLGANHAAADIRGRTPLHIAASLGSVKVIEALLNSAAFEAALTSEDAAGNTPPIVRCLCIYFFCRRQQNSCTFDPKGMICYCRQRLSGTVIVSFTHN